jgi:CheY-like chemotaxis protein
MLELHDVWHLSAAKEALLVSGLAFYAILWWLLKDPPPVVRETELHEMAEHANRRRLDDHVSASAGRPADTRVVVTESIAQHASPVCPWLDGVTVLLVEDDSHSGQVLTACLQSYRASVLCVGSAADAIQTLEKHEVDVLLCDLGVAFHDGFALIHRLRTLHNSSMALIPAVSITASRLTQDRNHALAAGYHIHIETPIDCIELISAIRAALSVAFDERRRSANRCDTSASVGLVTN